jgi:hypothetical protein
MRTVAHRGMGIGRIAAPAVAFAIAKWIPPGKVLGATRVSADHYRLAIINYRLNGNSNGLTAKNAKSAKERYGKNNRQEKASLETKASLRKLLLTLFTGILTLRSVRQGALPFNR